MGRWCFVVSLLSWPRTSSVLLTRFLFHSYQALLSDGFKRVSPSLRPLPHPNLRSKLSSQHQHFPTYNPLRNSSTFPSPSNSPQPSLSKRLPYLLALLSRRGSSNHESLQLRLLLPISPNCQYHRRLSRFPSSSWTSLSSLLNGSFRCPHPRRRATSLPSRLRNLLKDFLPPSLPSSRYPSPTYAFQSRSIRWKTLDLDRISPFVQRLDPSLNSRFRFDGRLHFRRRIWIDSAGDG